MTHCTNFTLDEGVLANTLLAARNQRSSLQSAGALLLGMTRRVVSEQDQMFIVRLVLHGSGKQIHFNAKLGFHLMADKFHLMTEPTLIKERVAMICGRLTITAAKRGSLGVIMRAGEILYRRICRVLRRGWRCRGRATRRGFVRLESW